MKFPSISLSSSTNVISFLDLKTANRNKNDDERSFINIYFSFDNDGSDNNRRKGVSYFFNFLKLRKEN